MTTTFPSPDEQISAWRAHLSPHAALSANDLDELEDHLRSQIHDLVAVGLTPDEAFTVGLQRLGRTDHLTAEFAREHADRLWRQWGPEASGPGTPTTTEAAPPARRPDALVMALVFGVLAGFSTRVVPLMGLPPAQEMFHHALTVSLYVAPFVGGWLAWRRRPSWPILAVATLLVVGGTALLHAVAGPDPWAFGGPGSPERHQWVVLAILAMPVVAWCAVGLVHRGDAWRSTARGMDFVRFTGEFVIYYALIALGGLALTLIGYAAFFAVGIDPGPVLVQWVLPLGAASATVIAAYLVEAKKSVIENMAPVLTKVFTPLAVLLLLALLAAMAFSAPRSQQPRELLIIADVILLLVLALLVYAWSSRDRDAPAGWFEVMQLVLVGAALAVNAVGLLSMVGRLAEWGATPNKAAALGLNLILLVNLAWSMVLLAGFWRGRRPFGDLERWQIATLPLLGVWAAVIVAVFPLVFRL